MVPGVDMAQKATNTAEETTTQEEALDSPLIDSVAQAVKKLVARGKERGYITYDELNGALPGDQVSSEQIEDTMAMLSELGINLVEGDEGDEPEAPAAEEAAEGETRAGNVDDDDIGRTDDPVRMYLREMGSVELLSREGEIAIAKRIEAGREAMIGGICESPLTIKAILAWRENLLAGKMLLRDVIDLDATYGAGPDAVPPPALESIEAGVEPEPAAEAAEGEEPAPEGELAAEGEDAEGEENSISLAAMEAALKPQVFEAFDAIAKCYASYAKLAEKRMAALKKGEEFPKATEKRYEKARAELVEATKKVRLNALRIEQLVEQLNGISRRLTQYDGRMLRLAESSGVPRQDFLTRYLGHEQDIEWAQTVAAASPKWKKFTEKNGKDIGDIRNHIAD